MIESDMNIFFYFYAASEQQKFEYFQILEFTL